MVLGAKVPSWKLGGRGGLVMTSSIDMENLTVKRFISGPLENTPDVRAGTPPGYSIFLMSIMSL